MEHEDLKTAFLWTARAEGLSLILLVFICMPLKYYADWPVGVQYMGRAHGALFLLYVALLAVCAWTLRWGALFSVGAFFASGLPFGTFVMERWLPKS